MADYLLLLVMFALVGVFGAASLILSRLLSPSKPTRAKLEPYECGIVPEHGSPERFPVKFYLVAMVFLLFDIEIVFIYPWAVRLGDLGVFGLVEMLIFVSLLLVAFAYLWREGIFDWGPSRATEADLSGSPRSRYATGGRRRAA